MTTAAVPRGSLEEMLTGASPEEEGRVFHHAYAVMEHLSATRDRLLKAVEDPRLRTRRVPDGHDHPDRAPCIHCGLEGLNLLPVTRGVFITLLEESRLTPEWNCVPSRRRSSVRRKLEELPTDDDVVLAHLYGPRWFDVLWVALQLERLNPADLARFTTRLPPTDRLPRVRDVIPGGLASRLTACLSRRDHRVGGLVCERLECHLYRVSQGSLAR